MPWPNGSSKYPLKWNYGIFYSPVIVSTISTHKNWIKTVTNLINKISYTRVQFFIWFNSSNMGWTLTQCGRVKHISMGNLGQAIIWTNAGILLDGPWGTNFSEILSKIYTYLLKKMYLKMLFGKWRRFWLSLHVLNRHYDMFSDHILKCILLY